MQLALLLLTCLSVCGFAFGHLRADFAGGNDVTDETKGGLDGSTSVVTDAIANQENHHQIDKDSSPLHTRLQFVGDRRLQGDYYQSYQSYQYCPPGETVLDVYVFSFPCLSFRCMLL